MSTKLDNEFVDDSKPIKVNCEKCNRHKKLWSVGNKLLDEYQHLCYNCKKEELDKIA